jgi:F-type H+-transporting ATPase subunit delta
VAQAASSLGELAARYALALYELAQEQEALDAVADDLSKLASLIKQEAELYHLLHSPILGRAVQAPLLERILTQAGAHPLVRQFVALVAHNRRLAYLTTIIRAFNKELAQRRGEVLAEITAAKPLASHQNAALEDTLKAVFGTKVSIAVHIDPGLIGGLIVKVGSKMVDSSLRSKLQKMQYAMKGIG